MDGIVKWFSKEKGFGFISPIDSADRFFHISQVKGADTPSVGDGVRFEPTEGRNGKPAAKNVVIVSKAKAPVSGEGMPRRDTKPAPYYGNATYRTVRKPPEGAEALPAQLALGAAGLIFGPVGGVIGAMIGTALMSKKEQVEITSPCLKCGGTGQVTNRVDGYTGFQCPRCKAFWKQRDRG